MGRILDLFDCIYVGYKAAFIIYIIMFLIFDL